LTARQRLAHEQVAGTERGYNWHVRHGSLPCEECTAAHAESMEQWRDRRNPDRPVRVPLSLLGRLLAAAPHADRAEVTEELGAIADRALTIHQTHGGH
jgi:hypothetical protein